MTKYSRFTGKVFGGNATATGNDPQIAQFGSALANTFVGTTDPETIQSLPAWGQGWIGAVTPETQFPPMPEMTGVMKVLSHQICGILQQGVPEWDNGTIYYEGNFCSKNGIIYVSTIDENQGIDPENDTINWNNYGGANLDLSNLTETGEKHFLNKSQITNCLLEIPQNIKLDLTDGVLTLKAGSKVIVPNGAGVFEEVTTPQDIIIQETSSMSDGVVKKAIIISTISYGYEYRHNIEDCYSGTTAPVDINTNSLWYDTENNIIKRTTDGGATWISDRKFCLPVGIYTRTNGVPTSIDEVFNGAGYVANTIWCDKGVKCLRPNGRNEDGTLRNVEFTTTSVLTQTRNLAGQNKPLVLNKSNFSNYAVANYNSDTNYNIGGNGANMGYAVVGTWSADETGRITEFKLNNTFHAVGYNDFDTLLGNNKTSITSWAFPSSTYVALNLDFEETVDQNNLPVYAAEANMPADGWVWALWECNGTNDYIQVRNKNKQYRHQTPMTGMSGHYSFVFPFAKDDVCVIYYTTAPKSLLIRFIYAKGAE